MTATTQHGPHPPGAHLEAELLSAFTDRALPAHERNHVLAHLAVCARCRQVVALAASAGELESHTLVAAAAAAPSHGTTAARRHTTWWRNWHFAWIPVAALVATVSLAAYIHIVHIDRAAQLARNNPPAVSQNETTSPAPAPSVSRVPSALTQKQTSTPQPFAKSQPQPPSFTGTPAPPEPRAFAGAAAAPRAPSSEQAPAAPPPASVTETVTVASDQSAPETASAQQSISLQPTLKAANSPLRATPLTPAAPPASTASPAAPQLQAEREKKFADFNRQVETAETSDHLSAARASPQSAPVAAAVSASNTSAAAYTQRAASSAGSIAAFGSLHGLSSNAGLAGAPIRLPSGLELASIASSSHLLLAIDKSGALFLTQDSGVTWRQVAHQWTGRAVLVRTRNLADRRAETAPAPTSGADPASASPAPPAPSIVFEIVNEKNQVWQSPDGLIWMPK
jgi:hypothetical protein